MERGGGRREGEGKEGRREGEGKEESGKKEVGERDSTVELMKETMLHSLQT